MRFRKTRIAISACCVVLCLLLIGLWVRSYRYSDAVSIQFTPTFGIAGHSFEGGISWGFDLRANDEPLLSVRSEYLKSSSRTELETWRKARPHSGFEINLIPNIGLGGVTPHYFFALLLALAGVFFYRTPKRFGLRTLLIAMTAIAVGLWFILWMAGK
jgi:hypothetical protein